MSKTKKHAKKHESHKKEKKEKKVLFSISKDNLTTVAIILAIIVIFVLVMNIDKIFPSEDETPDVVEGEEGVLAYVNGVPVTQEMVEAEIAKLPAFYQQMDPDP